jgi:hypothetical protein
MPRFLLVLHGERLVMQPERQLPERLPSHEISS